MAFAERFRGLFWTQLLGAFNDNFFKQALLILIVFQGFGNLEMKDDKLSELALAVFTVPFFLLSATAGQIADKFDKAIVIQRLKIVELVIAGLAGIVIPVILEKVGVDPALASGAFVTTVTDVVGFFAFLGLAVMVLL